MEKFLSGVTVTGMDNTIDLSNPSVLNKLDYLIHTYPFVEFGILESFSHTKDKCSRFPTTDWQSKLAALLKYSTTFKNMNISLHLCGDYVNQFLTGYEDAAAWVPLWELASRIQINTHGIPHRFLPDQLLKLLDKLHNNTPEFRGKTTIFQYDGANTELFFILNKCDTEYIWSALMDFSHGAGVAPTEWRRPDLTTIDKNIRVGYAGGLSVENLDKNLHLIHKAHTAVYAPDYLSKHQFKCSSWVDAETYLFDSSNKFDLNKVAQFLKIAQPWIVD